MPLSVKAWLSANAVSDHDDAWQLVELNYERNGALPTKLSENGREEATAAIEILDGALEQADGDLVDKALARLMVSTKLRADDGDDLKFRLAVYADELRYPPDVIEEACQKWARTEKWFPSVAEMIERCENLARWRRVTRDTLARMSE